MPAEATRRPVRTPFYLLKMKKAQISLLEIGRLVGGGVDLQATFDQSGGCSRSCSSEAPGLGGGVVFAHSLGEGLGHVAEVALLLGREGLA
jgi:hypothetical protein